MENNQSYSSHVKRLLKAYQNFAERSLRGPSELEVKPYSDTDEKFLASDNLPRERVQLPLETMTKLANLSQLITPENKNVEKGETLIEGELITCFVVGGEARICLPQLLKSVLGNFSLEAISAACEDLEISCNRCSAEQLAVLKLAGVLPTHATSCGLITKTNAERLCHSLLHRTCTKSARNDSTYNAFKVYHECFGKCKGVFSPDLYSGEESRCIECCECGDMYSPAQFVCHSHRNVEIRLCHWGFESSKWRVYLMLARGQDHTGRLQEYLDDMKNRFVKHAKFGKRRCDEEAPRSAKRASDGTREVTDLSPGQSCDVTSLDDVGRCNLPANDLITSHRPLPHMNDASLLTTAIDRGHVEARRRVSELLAHSLNGHPAGGDVTGDLLSIFDRQQAHMDRLAEENAVLHGRLHHVLALVEQYKSVADARRLAGVFTMPPLIPIVPVPGLPPADLR